MQKRSKGFILLVFGLILSLFTLSACNLGSAPQEPITQATATSATQSAQVEVTEREGGVTVFPTLTAIPFSTQSFVFVPPNPPQPTNTPAPISIVIISPLQGNVVAGTVQVVGSASHPNFLQYRLEYGPQPNLNNQWFSITGIVQTPVLGGPLGLWSTQSIPDGFYQLRLRVFLQDGTQQTTQVGNILVQNGQPTPVPTNTTVPQPIASFTQDLTQGTVPLVVSFKNKSQGQISSLSWSFGDGGSSSLSNPVYTYTKAGEFTVTLTVKGPGGTSNVSRQITVKSPNAPVANFAPNVNSGEAPLNVAFTNLTTGQVNSYEWNFGDDSSSTETNPTHIFNDVGTFNVILKATGAGGTSTMIQQITVENPSIPAPIADFAPSIAPAETGQAITFNNTSTGDISSYLWDFNGDGFTDNTDISPTHSYDTAGTYNVRLIVIGPGGQSTALKEVLIVSPPEAPFAAFNVSPNEGIAPLAVQFTNSTTGDVSSYEWDFDGDGVVDSTEASPAYTYQNAGTYNPILTAIGAGGSTTATQIISVQPPPQPPTAAFIADPQTGQAPLSVAFTNQSEGTELSYAWDFDGDGVADDTTENPTHTFEVAGDYTVSLQVIDPLGQNSTATQTISVSEVVVIPPPTAAFTFAPDTGDAPLTVAFTNQSTGDISGYQWDFNGDAIPDSTDTNPTFVFQTAGTYTISLIATGAGGSSEVSQNISVAEPLVAPQANFSANPTTGSAPLTVLFADASTGQVDTWSWDFNGDGAVDATDAGPYTFVFDTPATYNATLTVSNTAGSTNFSIPIVVENTLAPPVANFTADVTSGQAPLTVTFTDASTGQVDTWSWDFDMNGTEDAVGIGPHSISYDTAGTYTATLTASNSAGSTQWQVQIVVSEALAPPVANFTADVTSGQAPLTVTFTDASTGQVDSWSWDFNSDGIEDAIGQGPHVVPYDVAGTYTATLTVSNTAGSTNFSIPIVVENTLAPPVANFTADVTSGQAPLTVTFTDASTGQVDTWSWDFDTNGTEDAVGIGPHSISYDTAGTYTATLTASNSAGSTQWQVQIVVSEALAPPVANFTADVTSGQAPLTVTFTDASTGQVDTWSWDFNSDGIEDAIGQGPHVVPYDVAGTYTATLTASNSAGSTQWQVQIVVSEALAPPSANFTADVTSGQAPLTVTFTDASTGQVDSWSWDFNSDGIEDAIGQGPHVVPYDVAGTYTATLTTSNSAGSTQWQVQIVVSEALTPPVANFTADVTSGQAPLTVTFTDASTGQVDSWSWDFNSDGIEDAIGQGPHVVPYDVAGTYTATLTTSNSAGSTQWQVQIVVSEALTPPVANFTADVTSGQAPLTVTFTDASTGQVDSWSWDFNSDGIEDAIGQGPHVVPYDVAGTYTATLTTSNSAGSTQWQVQIVVSEALTPPVANFTTDVTSGQAPLTVTFTDASTGQVDSWSWDFNSDGIEDAIGQGPHVVPYDVAGTYTATLTTSNSAGSTQWQVQVTVTDAPAPSVNGNIAFVSDRDGNNEIYVVNDDGSELTNVTNNGANDRQPVWSPDGTKLAFVSDREGDNDIFVLNMDDLSVVQLTFSGANERQPTWSPDGSLIAFATNELGTNDIFTVNVSNQGIAQLIVSDFNERMPVWSPDGSQVLFVSDDAGNDDLYIVNLADIGNRIPLTTDPASDSQATWSSENVIAFVTDRDGDNNIYIINPDGSGLTALTSTTTSETMPAWSPDATRILYTSNLAIDGSGNAADDNIYFMKPDGTEQQFFTTDPSSESNAVQR